MKKIVVIVLLVTCALVTFAPPVISKEITGASFSGTWCGKWDNIYEFCIVVSDLEKPAKYKWKEHPNGKFKKTSKDLVRKNLNTLNLENIWFVLDEANLDQANALGVFKIKSRTATLKKLNALTR